MERLINKQGSKIEAAGLSLPGGYLFGAADDEIFWNRRSSETPVLEKIMSSLSINSLLFAEPAEPWFSIMNAAASSAAGGSLTPEDSETRTFLHEIPVLTSLDPAETVPALRGRKGAVIAGRGIITHGTVSPEQAFITFSSILFSLWVKFFRDFACGASRAHEKIATSAAEHYLKQINSFQNAPEMRGPFEKRDDIFRAIAETGRLTVRSSMVDSFFGNISYSSGQSIFISRTSASLDELEGEIDECPSDASSTAAITASSELSAHRSIYELESCRSILHGHPKFAVIMSMLCDEKDCPDRGLCHRKCDRKRFVNGIPVVPGEVGTGKYGISSTLPSAMSGKGAIVWGHGLFTRGKIDFTDAYANLLDIEKNCLDLYIKKTGLG
jgi:ribulose-5-phosphate 4-epimerase/fuculose-1-phosphate aldolase